MLDDSSYYFTIMINHPDDSTVRKRFIELAEVYAQHDAVPREIARRVLARLAYMRLTPSLILDLSLHPSDGEVLIRKAYPKARYVAMAPAVSTLQKRPKRWFQRRQSVCGFGATLPFQSRSVDFIFMNLTLSWVQNWPRLLAECQRVLTPGGMLLFSTLGPDTLKELNSDAIVPNLIDMHDIGDACVKAGLENPVMDASSLSVDYGAADALVTESQALNLIKGVSIQAQAPTSATFEVIVGHAWAGDKIPQRQAGNEVAVPLDNLFRR